MIFLNTHSRLSFRSVVSLSLWALLSVGLLSGCSEESQQKASETFEKAKDSAKESMEKTQDAVEETVDEASKKVGEVTDSVQKSVTEMVENSNGEVRSSPSVSAKSAEPIADGGQLYSRCVGCHGASGQGGVGPKLAGQAGATLLAKLKAYRSGEQVGPMTAVMAPNVTGLSDGQLESLVAYITQF